MPAVSQNMENLMIRTSVVAALVLAVLVSPLAAAKGPEIRIVDGKFSIHAEAVPLARLLEALDRATGMKSRVPTELSNRLMSVIATDLPLDGLIRKIFEGVPIDYAVVGGSGIVVTGTSQSVTLATGPVPAPPQPIETFPPGFQPPGGDQIFVNEEVPNQAPMPPAPAMVQPQFPTGPTIPGQAAPFGQNPFGQNPQPGQQQPAMIQTPFGPIPNPRANQPQGGQNPFGTLNETQTAPNIFGNTSPQIYGSPTPLAPNVPVRKP